MDVANPNDIERIVRAVLQSMNKGGAAAPVRMAAKRAAGVFEQLDDAVAAADQAQKQLKSVAMRGLCIEAIRRAGVEHARELAELAVAETGMGRVEDKIAKNLSQARATPGIECLSPRVLSGDRGLTLIENAAWGVIASVTPSTNPAATVINNAISMIAATAPVATILAELDGLANRGYTDGFYERHHTQDYQNYMTGHSQAKRSQYVGDVLSVNAQGLATVEVKNRFARGDRLEVIQPAGNREIIVGDMLRRGHGPVEVAGGSGVVVELDLGPVAPGALLARIL